MRTKSKQQYVKLKSTIPQNLEKKTAKNIKVYNYGLSILKSYLAFVVIVSHQFSRRTTKNKIILTIDDNRKIHVPSFFIMSFYFTYHTLLSLNIKKLFSRLLRLLIPYIIWPVILLQINREYNHKFHKNLKESIEDLKFQLYWGSGFLGQFWFQWDVIVTSLLFVLIIFIFKKHYLFILQLILILFYHFQYTGNYFKNYLKLYKIDNFSVLRMFEMIPL